MRSTSYLASLTGLILIAIPLAISFQGLPSETAFPNRWWLNASSPAERSETCLRLGFAARSGLYLANVRVAISDTDGSPVAELISDGPWLQVNLAPGVYNVMASFDGKVHELRDLRLADGDTVTHVMYWDLNVMPMELIVQVPPIKSV
jgi:hypothetical protein